MRGALIWKGLNHACENHETRHLRRQGRNCCWYRVDAQVRAEGLGRPFEVIEGDGAGKAEITNREELKKQADELGIEYARNVSNEKLQELIDAKLAE